MLALYGLVHTVLQALKFPLADLITFILSSSGTGVPFPPVERTGAQVDMVVVTRMTAMKAAMAVSTTTEMEMGGKETMKTGTMADMVDLEIHPTGKEIVIQEILMNAMAEIIEKMNTKEVIATMNILKEQVVGAMVGKGIHMGMMKLIHPGLFSVPK